MSLPERERRALVIGRFLIDRGGVLALALLIVYVALAMLGWGILESNNRAAEQLSQLRANSERLEEQTDLNERLVKVIQDFNEEHAVAAGESFDTLNTNLNCMFAWMADYNAALAANLGGGSNPLPAREQLDACFKPITPQPQPVPNSEREREKPK